MNIIERIIAGLKDMPEAPFLVIDGEVLTRDRFLAQVAARSRQLRAAGIAPDDRVLVATDRRERFWRDLAALWTIGAVPVPLDAKMPARRAQLISEKTRPRALLGDLEAISNLPPDLFVVAEPPQARHEKEELPQPLPRRDEDTGAILFTSGSTGDPKGVVLSHHAISGNALATLLAIGLGPADRLFVATPFHFTSAICHFLAVAFSGATLATTETKLLMGDLHRRLIDSGATCFGGSPIQLRWIAECCEDEPLSIRWVMSSGDRLGVDVIGILKERLPDTQIFTFYGLTEVGGRFCVLPPELLDTHAGSVGRPIPGMKVTVRDENGREMQAGELGEVYAAGDYFFAGYLDEPELTAAVVSPHGFKTGDLGFIDKHGLLHLKGRADDVFKSSGQKVSAVTIVDALTRTGLFEDVAVIGKEHPTLGSVPYVFYVMKTRCHFDKRWILENLRATLPANHLPKGFSEVPAIPRTDSGKVERLKLQEIMT